jgi:site-specific DNA-methyltransferase (adenine-specific)
MAKLPGESVDFVLTDPPYIARYRDRNGRSIINDDNANWLFPAFAQIYRVLKPDSFCVSFYGWHRAETFLSTWKKCGFRPVGHFTWVKRYASSIGYAKMCHESAYLLVKGSPARPTNPPPDVLPWHYSGNKFHPTQKPISALAPLLQAFSRPGSLVLDPFSGSGSTAIAAAQLDRRFLAFEKDPAYFDAAVERISAG